MTAEQRKIVEELFEVAECAAREGVSLCLSVGVYQQGERAQLRTRVSVANDHHMLDLQREQLQAWSEATHKKDEGQHEKSE